MRTRIAKCRRAAAVVELAICLPVVVLLTFGALEGANMLFLRQAVVQSAYEAGKIAAKSNGGEAKGRQLALDVLSSRDITATEIRFNPTNVDSLAPGTPFTVTVSVAGDQKSITNIGPFGGLSIESSTTMHKE